MNSKTILACCITTVVILALAFDGNVAKSKSEPTGSVNIGVVSVKRIFDECRKNTQFEKEMTAEQEKIIAELEKSRAEIDAERAGKDIVPKTDTVLNLPDFPRREIRRFYKTFAYEVYKKQSLMKAVFYRVYYSQFGELLIRFLSPFKDILRRITMGI